MVRRFAVILLAALSALLLAGGTAQAAPTTEEHVPAGVAAKEPALPLKTTIYLHFEQRPDGSVAQVAYPTGCGITVTISRWANTIDNDTFTKCSFAVASIQHNLKIQRSRWYGWETLQDVTSTVTFNSDYKFNHISYDCGGTGIHDFRIIGSGQVIPYGQPVTTAAAYDQLDNQNCG
ncbi:hypothetical protein [Actinokineospora enzanensis]|uniref:hypothetical protein n=1 Tax=Actinokineospora enzanensis TaxID=155975 RepID=UPI0012EC0514|nr:hypothetical protein [Actinokineospora enzanensis]